MKENLVVKPRRQKVAELTLPYIIHRLTLATTIQLSSRENRARPYNRILPRGNEKMQFNYGPTGTESPRRGSLMQQLARVNARRSNSHFLSIVATILPRKRPIIRRFITRTRVCADLFYLHDEKESRQRTYTVLGR